MHNLCMLNGDAPNDLPQYQDINPNDPRLLPVQNVILPRNNTWEGQQKRITIMNN